MTGVLRLDSRRARTLISEELFDLLTTRLAQDRNIDLDLATRIMDQTLAFLAAAGHPGERLSPSPAVDAGWHLFLRWTKDYAAFCERVAGRFIHHVPDDTPAETSNAATARGVLRTLEAIEAAGYLVDHELWALDGKCGSCHEDGNCSSSGEDGNENTETRKR
ncbi:glycine-rich domain-containing protein [Actinokineospora xionganensis]|uniref:Uncharacterized protein n=1 Tax=Actinokineospora xionganensis TaxID=2684470 RepID=A0ABR7LCT7_9PSEU|nr:hypothetical protein [Actinokineospora xionganensis]MBC6450539.1 hypothetical protein [Actinokineospora xionganensis]